jgi:alpha-glucosidase
VTALLDEPHHDGSALYVSDLAPRLGSTVRVRLRVPNANGFTGVHVRLAPDGEQTFVQAFVESRDERDTWWAADLVVHNPVTNYRFVLQGGPTSYAWLNGAGLWRREVPDASDFRLVAHGAPPEWAANAVVYQVFPDRFARAGTAPVDLPEWAHPADWDDPVDLRPGRIATQLYCGDLDGVTAHLDHLIDLGVDVVYLTPFFPGRSNHRYDASTFTAVDPVLGGDEALTRLCDAAHARGIRVMGDFTTNHTGAGHEWFRAALEDEDAKEREFYLWDEDGGYVAWLGVPSLPKLNYDSAELRRRVFDDPGGVVRKWLRLGLDGWRVDVANMTGRHGEQDHNHEVAALMRDAAVDERPDALVVGEHVHDYTTDLPGTGWHGVMNYAGFTKPVWTWLRLHGREAGFLGAPVIVPELAADLVVETMRDFTSRIPWTALVHSFNLVGSHDTTRVRTLVGEDSRRVDVAAALLLTMPSIPMITYGDEIGMEGAFGEDGRRPMPWDEHRWDTRILAVYRDLVRARHESVALTRGGLRWVHAEGDAIVFLREAPGETALVHCARAAHEDITIPVGSLPGVDRGRAAFGSSVDVVDGQVRLTAVGPAVGVWTWPTT